MKALAISLGRPLEHLNNFLTQGPALRHESQSLGESVHELSNRSLRCAMLGLSENTDPPTDSQWAEGVRDDWVRRLPEVSITINHRLKLANGKSRMEMHHCRKIDYGTPIFHSKPANCLEVLEILEHAASTNENLKLLN